MEEIPLHDPEERQRQVQRLALVSAVVIVLTLILMPYRGVSIPGLLMMAFGLLGTLVLFMASLRRLDIVVILLAGYIPFSKLLVGDFGGIITGLNAFNMLSGMIVVGLILGNREREISLFTRLDFFLILYCLLGFISLIRGTLFLGEEFFVSLVINFKRWLSPILLYFIIIRAIDERSLRKDIIITIMVTVTLVGILGLKEFYIDKGTASSWEKARIQGIAQQPNQLGTFFVYYMPFLIVFLYDNYKRISAWLMLGAPILISFRAFMLTISRGAYVAFGLAMVFFLLLKRNFITMTGLAAIVFLLMFPELLPEVLTGRFENIVKDHDVVEEGGLEKRLEGSARVRVYVLRGGLRMIAEHPILGVGHDVFPHLIGDYSLAEKGRDTHNTYLTIATEMGLPALVIFLVILGVLFKNTYYVYRRSPDPFIKTAAFGFLVGLVGLSAANLFGSRLNSLELTGCIWILAAIFMREAVELKTASASGADREETYPDELAADTREEATGGTR